MNAHRIKVAYVIDDLGYGGAQRQASLLAPGLIESGVDVTVACMSAVTAPFGDALRNHDVAVTAFSRRHGADLSRVFALARLLRRERVDVVHSFLDASNVYAFAAASALRLPVVTSLRSDRLSVDGMRARVLRAVFKRSDFVVTNSATGRNTLVTKLGVSADRVLLVRNCVEIATQEASPDDSRPGRRVGFVGRLVPLKRVGHLIDAFGAIIADIPDAELILVGDGIERASLAERVRRAGLDSRVTFTGSVEDVRPLMRTFSCLVLPSSNEGLPNAILEALASGIPVVASPVGDIPDLVEEGRTGLLVRDDSVAALAAAIARALGDDELHERTREEGPRFVREHFSTERAVDSLQALYRSLV